MLPKRLFGVLYAASLRVPVPQEDELLLLARPQAPHALPRSVRQFTRQKFLVSYLLSLITLKLRCLLLSIIILYSSVPSSTTCLRL